MELAFERHYRHPIEKVWKAITTSSGLERWLMNNDFEAVVGRESEFHFCDDGSDVDRVVHVRVEALDPPKFMRWSWRHDDETTATMVSFELESTKDGTLLRVRHEGDVPPDIADRLSKGWPTKLENLEPVLSSVPLDDGG